MYPESTLQESLFCLSSGLFLNSAYEFFYRKRDVFFEVVFSEIAVGLGCPGYA